MSTILEETRNKLLPRIALIACGSFSPPTPMHFRMFEIARDHFEMHGTHHVIGGIVSPTHDAYKKKGLAPGLHRCAMVKLAVQSSSWIRVSDWETTQPQWSRTQAVLQYHQNFMNNFLNSPNEGDENGHIPGWLPKGLRERKDKVQLKLLCGADLLESFAVPGLWSNEDIEDIICNHGLVVISRSGATPEKFIFDSDILTKYQRNITLITNWVPNEVSSTMIRRLLCRGQSVKYLIDDLVLEYIKTNGLFNFKSKYITHTTHPSQNIYNLEFLKQVKTSASSFDNKSSSDDDERVNDEELMDEADFSIKTILTSINLDNRKPNVFCCGDSENVTSTTLIKNRSAPGQAVQVITSENTKRYEVVMDKTEIEAKKIKMSTSQDF